MCHTLTAGISLTIYIGTRVIQDQILIIASSGNRIQMEIRPMNYVANTPIQYITGFI